MKHGSEGVRSFVGRRAGRPIRLGIGVVAALGSTLLLVFVPYHSVSSVLSLPSGASASTEFSVPVPAWVTVHIEHRDGLGMAFWMDDASGLIVNRTMSSGTDWYSFWSWGGTYRCTVESWGLYLGSMNVWVNASWGLL